MTNNQNKGLPDDIEKFPPVTAGYPGLQIAKALTTAQHHSDEATRDRAWQKISRWVAVLNGMWGGDLTIGSRTPVKNTPAWATLQVVHGGFATGGLLAGGPLQPHELDLLAELSLSHENNKRQLLNRYFLSEAGLPRLQALLHSGDYRVNVPEEGALLVVAALLDQNRVDEARALVETLAPWFSQLRFYPVPYEKKVAAEATATRSATAKETRTINAKVTYQTVGETLEQLQQIGPNERILAQKETIHIWLPLYDQMVGLFLETVVDTVPTLQTDEHGQWERTANGQYPIVGGWPCKHYPDDWPARAQSVLKAFDQQRKAHKLCAKPLKKKESLAQLQGYLQRCVKNPQDLTGREVGRIRLILARYVTKRGIPTSAQVTALRNRQSQQASGPTLQESARKAIVQLKPHDRTMGLEPAAAASLLTVLPRPLHKKVQRCVPSSIAELIDTQVITSGESLARVLPQLTAGIQSAGITNVALKRVYEAIYQAFRQRRSLLLLNLQKQVQLNELPWMAAIAPHQKVDYLAQSAAQQTLIDIVHVTTSAFPQVIFPNKLIRELQALIDTAALDLPLTEEVAADIFMGRFSDKFLRAAVIAGQLLEGSLYATYYGIDYQQVFKCAKQPTANGREQSSRKLIHDNGLERICSMRAGVQYSGRPVISGMIIEQQQILTTHNLAVLMGSAPLAAQISATFEDDFQSIAQACFMWICRRLQIKTTDWHATLIQLKNSAYAWRQMIFFLSLQKDVDSFLAWADEYFIAQPAAFQARFKPAVVGLHLAAEGVSLTQDRAIRAGARQFLGWTNQRHWLMPPEV